VSFHYWFWWIIGKTTFVLGVMVYVMLETILYIPTLILPLICFQNRVYKRSMLLLFFNYIEMVFGFAVLYSFTNKFNKPLSHWFDSIYFSTVTSSTIGYGDLYPLTLWENF
jgi:hypothetical protein